MTNLLKCPYQPMEALSVPAIPVGPEWQYEPKWDGFRCVVFRTAKSVTLQSKSGQLLTRYFPEMVEAVERLKATEFVLDGELVIPEGKGFSFDALLQRIHPAASRVTKLSLETPALLIVLDILSVGDTVLTEHCLSERRSELENFAEANFRGVEDIRLSPATNQLAQATRWLSEVGPTLDGIVAKRVDMNYRSGERTGMQKIKNHRTADCVVGGFRYNEGKPVVGSLLLGLYDEDGLLHHVGFTSSLAAREKAALTKKLVALEASKSFTGNAPGGPSRWSSKRSAEWTPLKPQLVVEVSYDHFSNDRFRHGTRLLRWRPDKAPIQCTMDQITDVGGDLLSLLKSSRKPRMRRVLRPAATKAAKSK